MHDKHRHSGETNHERPHRTGAPHALRLFILNAVLYLACGAFAGAIALDYLPVPAQMKVLALFAIVPLVMAVVSTITHVKSHKWTSVDDMAERFGK